MNRAGKSSLLAALVAEAPVTAGSVELRGKRVGYLSQVPSPCLAFCLFKMYAFHHFTSLHCGLGMGHEIYRGTSLIRNTPPS